MVKRELKALRQMLSGLPRYSQFFQVDIRGKVYNSSRSCTSKEVHVEKLRRKSEKGITLQEEQPCCR